MNMVIVGGGAVGLIHAALLSQVAPTTLLVRRPEHAEAVRRDGVTVIHPDGSQNNDHLEATNDPNCLDQADFVIVAVKSYDTVDVAQLLASHGSRFTTVLSLQNGLGHEEALVAACGRDRVLPGITGYAGRRRSDSVVEMSAASVTVIGSPTVGAANESRVSRSFLQPPGATSRSRAGFTRSCGRSLLKPVARML